MTAPQLNIRLPTPGEKYDAQNERELRRQIELGFLQVKGATGNDGIFAAEVYLYNAGSVLTTGDSDWLYIPWDFVISSAEIVADTVGSITVAVYASSFTNWPNFSLVSGSAPMMLSAVQRAHPALTGWTRSFTGGTYLKFSVTSVALYRKATITLNLAVRTGSTRARTAAGTAGGVLSGTYPDPSFAEDMATQAELNAAITTAKDRANHTGTQLSSTISDFNSATRAQVESELVAGSNITITPSGSGASRQLTIASSSGGAMDLLSYWPSSSSTITASESFATTPPSCAFIRGFNGWIDNGSALPQWIQIQFPFAVTATKYAIMPWWADNYPGRTPKTWTLAGSNNGSSFTTLDTQTNYTAWTSSQERTGFSFTNTTAYAYYRWTFSANNGNAYTGVGGLWLYGQPS